MAADLRALDLGLLRAARTAGHTPARERAVRLFSYLGEHGAIWLAGGALAAAADRARRGAWLRADGVIAGAYVANQLVKVAVRRRRPQLDGLPQLARVGSGLSFPSAHATASFAGVQAFRALGAPAAPLLALAGALSASRVWLGVHYPSDVVAGAALGTAIGRAAA